MSAIAYIGLGSNLDQPIQQLLTAYQELANLPETTFLAGSSLYSSKPVGPQDQPDFVNAVVKLETKLSAIALLDALQALEQQHQRVRLRHWGPRTLDLDLLLYDQQQIALPRLSVPHPQMHLRGFVLLPLAEISPEIVIPGKGSITTILSNITIDDLQILLKTE
ncbi:2-amino-4-hydroxy-6-hydroxymethyldihydropteridinediphosphokinase [Oceanospirillum multiglobuliferum]|uniref:2-amino-4-hydroxy-6-hydroxymethyldihydropteridine pyrophosphokinase n=1 Tax=Oceanospirillum multiglobuliferum TaxID=64969 RepID=A0A1T4RFL8_9GAMM|nr:2-amino-4-hydroxy-6-hydroxymethyldihydropteridine diphosphokinase [Oceanospirillum multiglobuliferum]OPX54902.1 2-amino-4-hydroxy-6-hydroxymethyldihydropteridine diphosphokinase [Oceanospirillum multiglobuliferum]SKA14606.1 2-amino-4-hydroxy-6-hydroxymethyldihydropteridinediphosphokinase [Oceanospirillum multiglobuliferum]